MENHLRSQSQHLPGIIIPAREDYDSLKTLLPELFHQWSPSDIMVADGSRNDDARSYLWKLGVQYLHDQNSSRASRMNLAAKSQDHEVLLFLHADTQLPANAASLIMDSIRQGSVGGAFARRFSTSSPLLYVTCRMADWRGRWWGWFLGDQAIFVRKDIFDSIGGFPDWPRFEDFELSKQMARRGKTSLLLPPLTTSGRRFSKQGALRQTLIDLKDSLLYLYYGIPPELRKSK